MRMGGGLLDAVRSGLAGKRHCEGSVLESAIAADGHHGDAAGGVIGNQQEAAGWVDGLVHSVAASGGRPIDDAEVAGFPVDGEGGSVGLIAVDGVKDAAIWPSDEK